VHIASVGCADYWILPDLMALIIVVCWSCLGLRLVDIVQLDAWLSLQIGISHLVGVISRRRHQDLLVVDNFRWTVRHVVWDISIVKLQAPRHYCMIDALVNLINTCVVMCVATKNKQSIENKRRLIICSKQKRMCTSCTLFLHNTILIYEVSNLNIFFSAANIWITICILFIFFRKLH